MDAKREMLRHTVATVAYRGAKTLRDVPPAFASYLPDPSSRTPVRLVAHLADLYDWALSLARGAQVWHDSTPGGWPQEVERFFASVRQFDEYLASDAPLGCSPEKLFQGPVADSLTHVGQLAMLRRLAGARMKSENYFKAAIEAGRVGPDQTPPGREFD
jgi:hypothetical protein